MGCQIHTHILHWRMTALGVMRGKSAKNLEAAVIL